jgi:hypothetical protein
LSEDPLGLWLPQPAAAGATRRERRAARREASSARIDRKAIGRLLTVTRPSTAALVFAAVPPLLFADFAAAYFAFSAGPTRAVMMVLAGVALALLAVEVGFVILWLGGVLLRRSAESWRAWCLTHPAQIKRLIRPLRLMLLALLIALVIRPPIPAWIVSRPFPRWHGIKLRGIEGRDLDFGQNEGSAAFVHETEAHA